MKNILKKLSILTNSNIIKPDANEIKEKRVCKTI